MKAPYICEFSDNGSLRLDLVGGKARNLAQLAKVGFPVPAGFCLTTEAYRAFVGANAFGELVKSTVKSWNTADLAALRRASENIRLAFLAGVVPAELAAAIERTYDELGADCAVAVRSSATAEDLATASFAGGQATVLNVTGLVALCDAIRNCWASLWTDRVIAYRQRLGIDEDGLALAIIVQKMVDAKVSGVLFTADPVSGDRESLVLEACWGLGEALVSGRVTPDHFELDRSTLGIRSQRRGDQTEMVVARNGQVYAAPVGDLRGERFCLDQAQVREVARIGLDVEEHFGQAQDIEWAIGSMSPSRKPQIHLLQARPITTVQMRSPARAEVKWESPVPGACWVRRGGGIVEHLPTPPSPLYATAQLPEIFRLHDAQYPEMGGKAPVPGDTFINGYYYSRSDYPLSPVILLLPYRYWKAARRGARWWRRQALPAHLEGLEVLSSFDVSTALSPDLLDHLDKLLKFNAVAWDTAIRASRTYVFTEPLFCRIFQWFVRPVTGGDPVVFLRGFDSQVMSAECTQWRLVRGALLLPDVEECIRQHPPDAALKFLSSLPSCRQWYEGLLEYCRKYGHVTTSHDYMYSTAADDPRQLLDAVRIRMELPTRDPGERQRDMAAKRERATAEVIGKLGRHPIRRSVFRWILEWAQEGASTREDVFFHALRGWPLARRAILELGARLVQAGAFSSPEDVFFLRWDELQQAVSRGGGDFRTTVAERRLEHQFQSSLTPPPRIPMESPRQTVKMKFIAMLKRFVVGASNESCDGLLRGAPVSPGTVTGPARIIHSTAEFGRLQSGDILVTRTATPAWTPTFAIIAGLVTDVGGPLSHSSIIAREFGIPAVMGVHKATITISEGQLVTIDGSHGSIKLH